MISTLSPNDLERLESAGYIVVETSKNPLIQCTQLKRLSERLYAEKYFKTATIGEAKTTQQNKPEIRNDFTLWIDDKNWPSGLKPDEIDLLQNFCHSLTQIQTELKNYFRLSLNSYETHFAIYPKGHFYKKHVDQTAENNRRHFSFVLYLNQGPWSESEGGQLVGYKGSEKVFEVLPTGDRMIIFFSSIEHEVLPTQRERFSITGWFRND